MPRGVSHAASWFSRSGSSGPPPRLGHADPRQFYTETDLAGFYERFGAEVAERQAAMRKKGK